MAYDDDCRSPKDDPYDELGSVDAFPVLGRFNCLAGLLLIALHGLDEDHEEIENCRAQDRSN